MKRTRMPAKSKTARKTPAKPPKRRSAASGRDDAVSQLTQDHREVQRLVKEAEDLEGDDPELQEIVEKVCRALTVHAQIEEEVFYPAVKDALEEDEEDREMMAEAEVEHQSAKDLIAKLEAMAPGDAAYKATFKVLGEYVNHHVKEEETEMFPAAKKAKLDLAGLGEEMKSRREQLEGEIDEARGLQLERDVLRR